MYRIRDFKGKIIKELKGKKIGVVEDVLININTNKVCGFKGKRKGLLCKSFFVLLEDVIYFGDNVIIKKVSDLTCFSFYDVKDMEVIDLNAKVIGIVEDILFSESDFDILGLVVSESFLKRYTRGKRIILIKDIILGDKEILFHNLQPYYFYNKLIF